MTNQTPEHPDDDQLRRMVRDTRRATRTRRPPPDHVATMVTQNFSQLAVMLEQMATAMATSVRLLEDSAYLRGRKDMLDELMAAERDRTPLRWIGPDMTAMPDKARTQILRDVDATATGSRS